MHLRQKVILQLTNKNYIIMIGSNIKYLRKANGLTQNELAEKIKVNRAMIGSYEEDRAQPKISVLQALSVFFKVSIDDLVNLNFENTKYKSSTNRDNGDNLRILTTTVDSDNNELFTVVPQQARAGYTEGFSDPAFIEKLPVFNLPLNELSNEKSYRVFQIKGDSMEPIKTGSYIICEYVVNWTESTEGQPHIVITKDDGIVYKRILKHNERSLLLKSDNKEYQSYTVPLNDVLEIWKALGYISFSLPDDSGFSVNELHRMYMELKQQVEDIKFRG